MELVATRNSHEMGSLDGWPASRISSHDSLPRKKAFVIIGIKPLLSAVGRGMILSERPGCIKVLTQETMNQTLELWKKVPGDFEEVWPPSQSKASFKEVEEISGSQSVEVRNMVISLFMEEFFRE